MNFKDVNWWLIITPLFGIACLVLIGFGIASLFSGCTLNYEKKTIVTVERVDVDADIKIKLEQP
ncbi:hypothetical protein KAR91_81325 [Candidatus Pacearchaeota archaeon]|nr:hypothetical protein [Candidatus Pacearchaeota archaeon]